MRKERWKISKQKVSLSLSANPKHLIKGAFFAAQRVFAEFGVKNHTFENNTFSSYSINGSGLLRVARNDICSVGRSMIEMLGVLAIVGVLSVGGIAGYSKAMEKWKIDKLMAEYNQLILGLLEYKDDLQKNVEGEPFLTDLVISLNLIPNTWKKLNGQFLEDSQGNWLEIRYRQADNYDINGHGLIIDFLLGGMETDDKGNQKSENFASKTCVELYNTILKPLHYTITGATVWGGNLDYFAGDRYCTKDYICLADATLNQIHEMCNSCDRTRRCNVTVFF